jgi:hypothetical protein
MEDIDKKVERALKLLRAIPADKQPVKVAFQLAPESFFEKIGIVGLR